MAVDQQGLLARLVRELVRLPGIGQKIAQRLAFHLLKAEREEALRLADAIRAVKDGLSFCRQCRNIAEGDCANTVWTRSAIRPESWSWRNPVRCTPSNGPAPTAASTMSCSAPFPLSMGSARRTSVRKN